MIITDLNGVTHEKCPRCYSAWIKCDDLIFGFECELNNCTLFGFHSTTYLNNQCQLLCNITINNIGYTVAWQKGFCTVNKIPNLIYDDTYKLPILPYDISLNKLKTYLLFS
jgi:hypothetical protein